MAATVSTVSKEMTLEEREALHHDEWAESIDVNTVDVEATWKGIGCPEVKWIAGRLGDLRGKRVLDLGSGLGEGAIWFASQGARVTALDISSGMLGLVHRGAERRGLTVRTVVGSATDLSVFDDASFDVVYGANMLHHVDIGACVREVHRVLAPGGIAAFWDPVKYNPAIELYRRMAAGMRTEDEHPLVRADLATLTQTFTTVEARGFWLSSLMLFARFFLIDRIHPSADRYWKLVVERQDKHRRLLSVTHAFDRLVLRVCPPLRWVCWNMAVVCVR